MLSNYICDIMVKKVVLLNRGNSRGSQSEPPAEDVFGNMKTRLERKNPETPPLFSNLERNELATKRLINMWLRVVDGKGSKVNLIDTLIGYASDPAFSPWIRHTAFFFLKKCLASMKDLPMSIQKAVENIEKEGLVQLYQVGQLEFKVPSPKNREEKNIA